MPANWVFLAVPLALLCLIYWLYELIQTWRERRYLHAVFDGDRIQAWRSARYNHKRNDTHSSGCRFY